MKQLISFFAIMPPIMVLHAAELPQFIFSGHEAEMEAIEVQGEGGYRAYYAKPGRGTLQGGGTAGGLGMDHEFMESVLFPQVILYGFLGFQANAEGDEEHPRLPKILALAHHRRHPISKSRAHHHSACGWACCDSP